MRDITTSLNKAVDEYKQVMKDQDMRKKLKSKIQKS